MCVQFARIWFINLCIAFVRFNVNFILPVRLQENATYTPTEDEMQRARVSQTIGVEFWMNLKVTF